MTILRLAIRGFADGKQQFQEFIEVADAELDGLLPTLAEKHAAKLASFELHMIEIEFLDEPDENQRFFRFGTDPQRMVKPLQINLEN